MKNNLTSARETYFIRKGIRLLRTPVDDLDKRWIYAAHTNLWGALVLKFKGYKNFETFLIHSYVDDLILPLWKKEITHVN